MPAGRFAIGRFALPLHIHISTLFLLLIAFATGLISWYNFDTNTKIIQKNTQQRFVDIGHQVALEVSSQFAPALLSLNILRSGQVIQGNTFNALSSQLLLLDQLLSAQPQILGLQLGFSNGNYFIVRRIYNQQQAERYQAQNSYLIADFIDAMQPSPRLIRYLYNSQYQLIGQLDLGTTQYDPRLRPWYQSAIASDEVISSDFYQFHFSQVLGLTLASQTQEPGVVVAIDFTLNQLSAELKRYDISPSAELVVIRDADQAVLAYSGTGSFSVDPDATASNMMTLDQLGSGVLRYISDDLQMEPHLFEFEYGAAHWRGVLLQLPNFAGNHSYLLLAAPDHELLIEVNQIRDQSVWLSVLVMVFSVPLVWWLAKRIALSLQALAGQADKIRQFDFSVKPPVFSLIKEVKQLALASEMMERTIAQFMKLLKTLSAETDLSKLQAAINRQTMEISKSDGVILYLLNDDEDSLHSEASYFDVEQTLRFSSITHPTDNPISQVVHTGQDKLFRLTAQEPLLAEFTQLSQLMGCETMLLMALPLKSRDGDAIGALCLLFQDQADKSLELLLKQKWMIEQIHFIKAMSGFASLSLETGQLIAGQKRLLESVIKLIAGAIDAKSPYTGGHCQRVPELSRMLAVAACKSRAPGLSHFKMSEHDWEVLHIASWLHDCGKVTTPEYVIDKATKLETIYDRIDEIRMRFEVLKRDAEIQYWQQLATEKLDADCAAQLKQCYHDTLERLDKEFAFVAQCNCGAQMVTEQDIQRLQQIATQTWKRTLDDRIGIGWESLHRKARTAKKPLPVTEPLLADKPEHLIFRETNDYVAGNNPWGFVMPQPELKYHQGELYNLSVSRGTLTKEERFKINEHIIQTIMMLDALPFPKHLRSVPEVAGGHHEKMDGTGYPKGLKGDELPLAARIIAVADVFEALSASDRPYKKPKTLSQIITQLVEMALKNHIDSRICRLLLESGVYMDYATAYISPELIDEVDIAAHLARLSS